MPTNTTNYNLIKPADVDDADISVINANMDTIDQTLKSIEQHTESLDAQNIKIDGEQILTGVKIFPTLISNGDNNHLQFFRNFAKEWHMEALNDKLSIVQSGVAERLSIQKDGNISINGALNVPTPVQAAHAVNKQYVDENLSVVNTSLSMKAAQFKFTATVSAVWSGSSAPYTQVVAVPGLLVDDDPHISPIYSTNNSTAILENKAWGCMSKGIVTANNITFTCFKEKPVTAITIKIEVMR